jgi:hypothetical protein
MIWRFFRHCRNLKEPSGRLPHGGLRRISRFSDLQWLENSFWGVFVGFSTKSLAEIG